MNVSLTPELERFVQDHVKSGMYQTASEVVREGLRLLAEREGLAELRLKVQAGFDEIERGDYHEYTEAELPRLAEEIKAEGRKQQAAMKRKARR